MVIHYKLFEFAAFAAVSGNSLDTDKEVLLNLKSFLEEQNRVNRGRYIEWNERSSNPCEWYGILCSNGEARIIGIDLSDSNISGEMFNNFSALTHLQHLNLSTNTLNGVILDDLNRCHNLVYLNLSHSILGGELMLTGLTGLEKLDLSTNRFHGEILDLSENKFQSEVPGEISNCKNLWPIPLELGSISTLESLLLGNNRFSILISESLLNLKKLASLDLSNNSFGGKVHEIFGRFTQLKSLTLHGNSYIDGILSSGIHKLTNMSQLDLSYNNFSGELPVEISLMLGLKFLILGYNQFTSYIPSVYGDLSHLQALDLSFNGLSGSIPHTFGNLRSLLWIMLANNSLTGEIPYMAKMQKFSVLVFSSNEFNGKLPAEMGIFLVELGKLLDLSNFNISFNPFLAGIILATGKLSTFGKDSFLGNPLLHSSLFNFDDQLLHPPPPPLQSQDKSEFWKALLTGYGCRMVLGVAILYSIFRKGEPHWFATVVDGIHEWRAKRLLKRKLGGKSQL
ncbi:hypothetical protein Gotri_011503 [Gossypium trilobum]|uniref:Leucine-rich repeat-containing N-terminal plant-type domain-containing protein n=1 Tax=Gossypium trilobum TaxID=34281 RepID=A0A7J9EU01_9ROSI|nr:hypothetical protein [Gossypium trilobum]